MQRKSPIAIGYGFYFYRLSKIPSTRVGALARVSCVYVDKRECFCVQRTWRLRPFIGALPFFTDLRHTGCNLFSSLLALQYQPIDPLPPPLSIRFSESDIKRNGQLAQAGTGPFRVLFLFVVGRLFLNSAMHTTKRDSCVMGYGPPSCSGPHIYTSSIK